MTRQVFTAGSVATMARDAAVPYGLVPDAAIGIEAGRVAFVVAKAAVPDDWANVERTDLGDVLVTPSLVDCHTHLVFGGHRAREFEMRLSGASYEEIARAGGGIPVDGSRDTGLQRG